MALKFKVGDLVKTTVTVGLDFQSFPIASEARVVAIIPRSGIPYPYMINLTQFNRDVAVMEKEIEFANGPITKRPPIYKKLALASGAWYIVEDNHGTHYTVVDTSDMSVRIGSSHNKNMFSTCIEDTSYVHLPRGAQQLTQAEVIAAQQAVQAKPNVCTCGVEKACGPNGRHSSWCDKNTQNKVSA